MKKLLLLLTIIFLLFSCNMESIVDTDGDGMSDSLEKQYFNPDVDPYTYNPKISDLPILDIDIYDVPQLSVNYITTNTSSYSSSTTRDSESEETYSIGGSSSSSFSSTLTAEASWIDPKITGSATVSGTVEISGEMSESIRKSISRSRERANERSMTAEEAKISVPVFIKNIGNTPVAVRDLILTAYSINQRGQMEMIGSLVAEDFKDIYLQPDGDPIVINFQNDSLYPSRVQNIMYYSRKIVVVPASYSMDIISNDEVKDYYIAYTRVERNTSRVHFRDGVYDVAATNLRGIFDVLGLDYTIEDDWITSLDGSRSHNILGGGEWQISHFGTRSNEEFEHTYNSFNPGLDAEIRPGDNIHIYKAIAEPQLRPNPELSHPSITSFEGFGNIRRHVTDIDVEVKLERNTERGVYQIVYLDIEPQKRLKITTPNDIQFEFTRDSDLSDPNSDVSVFREAGPETERGEHIKSYYRSPKRVFVNGQIADFTFEHNGSPLARGTLIIDWDEEIETLSFYFYGGADPNILPYTPQPTEEGASTSWYDLPHIETYIFEE